MDLQDFNKRAQQEREKNKRFLDSLKKKKRKDLDDLFHTAHEEVFRNTDCLQCANCCKTTSPIFYQNDIERAAKALKLKPGDFLQKYLFMDEDGDFVLKQAPCPFLGPENYCTIYEDRPAACREYPHTNRKKIQQILDITFRNTLVCPAVLKIVAEVQVKIDK